MTPSLFSTPAVPNNKMPDYQACRTIRCRITKRAEQDAGLPSVPKNNAQGSTEDDAEICADGDTCVIRPYCARGLIVDLILHYWHFEVWCRDVTWHGQKIVRVTTTRDLPRRASPGEEGRREIKLWWAVERRTVHRSPTSAFIISRQWLDNGAYTSERIRGKY
ncbi:hypothetical protein J6590_048021 [Homalodisca vitripennis]|nr:hypothetical protein J6590_048021 [Homalodisca vitripennis]